MKNNLLPLGTRDEFGRRAVTKQKIISVVQRHLNQRGFSVISTPLLEKQEVFDQYQLGNYQMYRFLDPEGDTIVLRPDMTLPIARFLSSTNIPLPQKFFYVGDIFRISRKLSGSYNELTQAGIELIGYDSLKAELECLTIINKLSKKLLGKDVEIELGIADFAPTLLENITNDKNQQSEIAQALYDKNIPEYSKLIQNYSTASQYKLLKKWPRLFGDPESIFSELKEFDLSTELQDKLNNLKEIIKWIKQVMPEQSISVDLSSRAPQSYYTGLTFRGFYQDGNDYLFSGGRYDKLLANFQDQTEPAVGMGIDIDLIANLITPKQKSQKTMIYFNKDQWKKAESKLAELDNGILSLSETKKDAEIEAKNNNATLLDLTGGNDFD
ncbi:ATP phosphoribosyltransferase regulatory subunit [Companilactobacillus baiquanensis]|uniref:ATP phosphoribosyltransferase regulatory subunit n=1 Tax=Companilactobacillus baiquanensis TaxID=2486005 RepID=A0ABW1UWP8_9LACO|nr:ATP phosphoribosyltransferase regulatory subunit [Companilactobacillus baiquanensis]